VLLDDADLTAATLAEAVAPIVNDVERAGRMSLAARSWARPHAAEGLARLALQVLSTESDPRDGASRDDAPDEGADAMDETGRDGIPVPHRVHLVGIGGAGMSGIARILAQRGHRSAGRT
jgi:hypothetical protein